MSSQVPSPCRHARGDLARCQVRALPQFNGENNHVHLLVNLPPKVALSKLVDSLVAMTAG